MRWRRFAATDTTSLVAIDVHVHVEGDGHGHYSMDDELLAASAAYFRSGDERTPTVEQIAAFYRERRMAAVIFTVDATTATGHPALPSEEIADRAPASPTCGFVRPWTRSCRTRWCAAPACWWPSTASAVQVPPQPAGLHAQRPERVPAVRGDRGAGGVPAVFHTGQTGIGAGLPGGRGIKLRLSDPMLIDDVAADFPGLTVILAHPSVPWQDAAISIATHKANVFIDLSGWSPKYFPPQLVRAMNSLLQDKVLFGTDYPLLTPERWFRDFDKLDVKPEIRPKIVKQNAIRLLGLDH